MEKGFNCIIVVKCRGVINLYKEDLQNLVNKLFDHEGGNNYKFMLTSHENYPEFRPSSYIDIDLRDKSLSYFDMFLDYFSNEKDKNVHIERITKILNYLWSLNVPAATYYIEDDDFEDHLPLKGGNDLHKVFWKDPDLEGI